VESVRESIQSRRLKGAGDMQGSRRLRTHEKVWEQIIKNLISQICCI
jgi:hypothetical protein